MVLLLYRIWIIKENYEKNNFYSGKNYGDYSGKGQVAGGWMVDGMQTLVVDAPNPVHNGIKLFPEFYNAVKKSVSKASTIAH